MRNKMLTTHRGQSVNHNYFVFTSVVSLQVTGSVYNDILHAQFIWIQPFT